MHTVCRMGLCDCKVGFGSGIVVHFPLTTYYPSIYKYCTVFPWMILRGRGKEGKEQS